MSTQRQVMQDYLDSLVKRAGFNDQAAIEADFVGTHTGEFAGLAATGRPVRVPYSVVYDLRDDHISALACPHLQRDLATTVTGFSQHTNPASPAAPELVINPGQRSAC